MSRVLRVLVAPLLAFLVLAAWAFASPVGAGPDDDYHLISTWCANGGSEQCAQGSEPGTREVAVALDRVACYAYDPDASAACQQPGFDGASTETDRGNFAGEYPPVYYTVMRMLAGPDLLVSALAMRLVNAALFVGLATALWLLLSPQRRRELLWGWLVVLVPLGLFLIPSNNPSGWALTGVGTAFLALLGWWEASGSSRRRRIGLGVIAAVGVLMAAGARGDAAIYAVGAVATATIIAAPWSGMPWRRWWRWAWLPAILVVSAVVFFATAGQSGVAAGGFSGSSGSVPPESGAPTGAALVAFNLLQLPRLWTGVWGGWALGWLDTTMPAIVPWAAASAFIVVAFAGIGRLDRRKAIALGGVLAVLVVLPVWVLSRGGNTVGDNLQPRYLLPLIALFALIAVTVPRSRAGWGFTRVQTVIVLGALVLANLVALQINLRRYVTGSDQQGFNLDAGAEWWWTGLPLGPTAVWALGALAYAGLLAVLWPQLRGRSARSAAELPG